MGQTKSIEDKLKEDGKFREFMATVEKESQAEEDLIVGKIDDMIKRHYVANGWDHARLFGNKQSDYQNYDDWSLARVIKIVDSIGNALEAGNYPSTAVPGSDKAEKSTTENAKDFVGAFAGDYSLIISRVKALISGVLSQFAVASEVTSKRDLRDMALSGGLHLFFGSSGKVYTNQTFFTNQFIGSFQIVFETYMSVDEAEAFALQQLLKTTEQELAMLNDLIIEIRVLQVDSLKKIIREKPQDYKSTKAVYDIALEETKLDRAKLIEEYNKYNQVIAAVDELWGKIDLTEFNVSNSSETSLTLDLLFNEWEAGIARRYISEKMQSAK